ncbi:hypothetical protein EGW08_014976, partial [Elysia chlorotica]
MDAPGRPEGPLDVVDIFSNRCALLWDKPKDDGGSPITHYIVEKMDAGKGEWEQVCETDDLEVDVCDLEPGHHYQFRVSAVNSEGVSEPLASDGAILAKDPWDPTSEPGEPQVIDYDKDYAELSWAPPEKENGAPVSGYLIEYREKGEKDWKKGVETGPENKGTVPGLKENKEYEFRVIAKNKAGPSAPSDVLDNIVLHRNLLLKPRIDQRTVPQGIRIKVGQKFTLGPIEFVGEPAPQVSWDVKNTVVPLEPSDVLSVSNVPKKSTVTCKDGVRKHTGEYTITVTNKHGSDSATIDVVVLGPPARPGGPLEVKDVTKDGATLTWTPPADDGGQGINNYRVEKFDLEKGKWERVANVQNPKCNVPKLLEGHQYKFRVIAESPNGDSEPLELENPITAKNPYDPADRPGKPEVKDRDRSFIELQWEPPKNDGGSPITGYEVERKEPKSNRWMKVSKTPVLEPTFKDEKVQEGKEYEYRVTALNAAGPSEPSQATAPVLAKPAKEAPKLNLDSLFGAKEIRVRAGEPLNIDLGICGAPDPTVEWLKDGQPIGSRAQTMNDDKEAKLHIPRAERGDTGKYTIKVANIHGEESADIAVVVLDKPGEPEGPLEVSDITAETVKLSWKPPTAKGGAEITGYVVEKCEEGSTLWEKVPCVVNGETCTAKGLKDGKKYKFRVKAENMYGVGEPLESQQVTAKNPFVPAGAPPAPNVDSITKNSVGLSWTKPTNDGGSKLTGYVVERKKKGGDWEECASLPPHTLTATISNLPEGEEFQFRVRAENALGLGEPSKPTKDIKIEDQPEKPKLDLSGIKDINVKAGQEFTLKIPYSGTPKPTAKWELDGNDVADPPRITIKVSTRTLEPEYAILHCAKSKREDAGKYQLTLKNAEGTDTAKVNVNVLDKPKPPTGPIEASDIDGESLTLTWNPPKDDGGEKINNYIVEKRKAGTNRWQKVSSFLSKPTCQVRNLEPGTKYEFRVAAENSQGVSDFLETETPVLAKLPYGEWGAPKCVATTEDSITLSWNPPKKDGGSPITGYVIEKKEKGDSRWTKANISEITDTEYTVRGLQDGTEYEFRVAAVNNAGIGEFSDGSGDIKAQPPPTAPKINRDLMPAVKDIKVKVGEEFKIAVPYNGNPIPTVSWMQGGMPVHENSRVKIDVQPDMITLVCKAAELKDSGKYTLGLSNEKGSDSVTMGVQVVDAPAKPEGPIQVKDVTPESCVLSWSPPKVRHHTPVSNYIVEKQDKATGRWEPASKFVRGTHYEVLGLEEGHEYNFRVKAENDYGVSEPLETSTATVAQNPFSKCCQGGVSRLMRYKQHNIHLYNPAGYVVEKREKGMSLWSKANEFPLSDNHFTVSGLNENSEYEFRIAAVNSAGTGDFSLP